MEKRFCELKQLILAFHGEEEGQDLIEYALIAALIALGCVLGMGYVASSINNAFSVVGNKLSNAVG